MNTAYERNEKSGIGKKKLIESVDNVFMMFFEMVSGTCLKVVWFNCYVVMLVN